MRRIPSYCCLPRFSSWKALQTPRTLSLPLWTEGRLRDGEMGWPDESSKSWAFWRIEAGGRLRTQISFERPLAGGSCVSDRFSCEVGREREGGGGLTVESPEERVLVVPLYAIDDDFDLGVLPGEIYDQCTREKVPDATVAAEVFGVGEDEFAARASEGSERDLGRL